MAKGEGAIGPEVAFEIVFRTTKGGREASTRTLDRFRPDPGDVAACQAWLQKQGVVAHPTGFSLACRAAPAVFESLFGVTLVALHSGSTNAGGQARWQIDGRARIPDPIAAWVEDVTLPPPPELF